MAIVWGVPTFRIFTVVWSLDAFNYASQAVEIPTVLSSDKSVFSLHYKVTSQYLHYWYHRLSSHIKEYSLEYFLFLFKY